MFPTLSVCFVIFTDPKFCFYSVIKQRFVAEATCSECVNKQMGGGVTHLPSSRRPTLGIKPRALQTVVNTLTTCTCRRKGYDSQIITNHNGSDLFNTTLSTVTDCTSALPLPYHTLRVWLSRRNCFTKTFVKFPYNQVETKWWTTCKCHQGQFDNISLTFALHLSMVVPLPKLC